MNISQWFSLVVVLVLGAMSPGPSLAVILNATLRGGAGVGYQAALGHAVGIMLYALLTVTGLVLIIERWPALYLLLQGAGAGYLLWLGFNSLRGAAATGDTQESAPATPRPALAGFLVAFLNPKVAVFMLALFAQFLTPDAGWVHRGVMVATALATDASWYLLVAALVSRQRFLERLRASSAMIDRCFGILIIVLALVVLWRTARGLLAW